MENNNLLLHYGVPGQKWGVRKKTYKKTASTKNDNATQKALKKTVGKKQNTSGKEKIQEYLAKRHSKKVSTTQPAKSRRLTDAELQQKINRIKLEKEYASLVAPPQKNNAGKDLVKNVLIKSGSNIATQATAYAMGAALNKIVGFDMVDPKNIQKKK